MEGKVYLIESYNTLGKVYKIGYTTRDIKFRLNELKTANCDINLVLEYKSKYVKKLETFLHNYFTNKKIENEWFLLSDDDIDSFTNICEKLEKNIKTLYNSANPFI